MKLESEIEKIQKSEARTCKKMRLKVRALNNKKFQNEIQKIKLKRERSLKRDLREKIKKLEQENTNLKDKVKEKENLQ